MPVYIYRGVWGSARGREPFLTRVGPWNPFKLVFPSLWWGSGPLVQWRFHCGACRMATLWSLLLSGYSDSWRSMGFHAGAGGWCLRRRIGARRCLSVGRQVVSSSYWAVLWMRVQVLFFELWTTLSSLLLSGCVRPCAHGKALSAVASDKPGWSCQ